MCHRTQDDVANYFASLPQNVQEMIKQSGIVFYTVDELRTCAEALTGQNSTTN